MDALEQLKHRVDALAGMAGVDPAHASGDAALSWVRAIGAVMRASETLLAPFAVRLEELTAGPSRYARWKGFPSAAALIAHETGISQSQAFALGALGHVMARELPAAAGEPERLDLDSLGSLPDAPPATAPASPPAPVKEPSALAKAARDHSLGTEAIRIIAATLEDMRIDTAEVEALLVRRARGLRTRAVRRLCLEVFAQWDPEGYAARQEAQRPRREIVFYPRTDGMVGIKGVLPVEAAGRILPWFEAEARAAQAGERALPDQQQRSLGQINADTLVTLVSHAQGCERASTRPKTTVVVRTDEKTLREGVGMASCDSLEAPITMQALRRMAIDAEVIPVVMGGVSLPLDVGRASRYATPAIRIAIAERDKGCAMCSRSLAWCDAHHIDFWKHKGRTTARNMVMLCVGCHHRVHDCGWIIDVDAMDNVSFIPPATVDPARRRQPASSARFAA